MTRALALISIVSWLAMDGCAAVKQPMAQPQLPRRLALSFDVPDDIELCVQLTLNRWTCPTVGELRQTLRVLVKVGGAESIEPEAEVAAGQSQEGRR